MQWGSQTCIWFIVVFKGKSLAIFAKNSAFSSPLLAKIELLRWKSILVCHFEKYKVIHRYTRPDKLPQE